MPKLDVSPESFVYSCPIRVRWGDMDAMGHVNNAHYVTYFEQARGEYFAERGIFVQAAEEGPVVANVECRYRAQVGYPATLRVYLRPVSVRENAFRVEYAIYHEETGRLAVDGSTLLIWVDFRNGRRAALPRQWIDILSEGKKAGSK